jgi:hypothetical protein
MPLGEPLIVNTDNTGGPGVHWVVMVKMRDEDHPGVYLYDPLGRNNKRVTSDGKPSKLKFDWVQWPASQLASTDHCGYFAIYVADLIRQVKPRIPEELGVQLDDAFGTGPDWGDARVAIQQAKRLIGMRQSGDWRTPVVMR